MMSDHLRACGVCGSEFHPYRQTHIYCSRACGKARWKGRPRRPQSTEYRIWGSMKTRCNNPASKTYSYYGGRGIKVCARWNDFAAFLSDMGPRPSLGHTLDRIDNCGDYEPGNCRWATKREQMDNRSKPTVKLTLDGLTMPVSCWADRLGLSAFTIWKRVKKGLSDADCLALGKHPHSHSKHAVKHRTHGGTL